MEKATPCSRTAWPAVCDVRLFLAGEGTLMIVGHQAINRTLLSLFLFQRPNDVPYTYIPQNQYYHITITQRKKLFEMIRYA